ncbi:transmembrane 220 family protein [Chitinophagaceae bacterium LB-8]|uniref:Transmembrane 220 family protein n=1 Tax=Paraflavisolibacter caeni TaxID=2982496 RepID=A0A9X3BJG5_9BACT|nr:transmembrane 220 family protein [Paraflavisolibacter caeni]MCU7552817.1 transmembrane 220 family protein [Paraflavisolibacter caeni]
MVIFNVLFVILFLLFTALQYNDPDPYVWMPLYLYGALLCWLAIKKIYKVGLFIIGIVVYALYAVYLFFDTNGVLSMVEKHHSENIVQTMKATKPWIEETREFWGLIILLSVLLINMVWLSSIKKRGEFLKIN